MKDQHNAEVNTDDTTKPMKTQKAYRVSKALLIGAAVGVVASAGCCAMSYPKIKKKYDDAQNHVKTNPGPMF